MKVDIKKLPKSEVEIKVEVPYEEYQSYKEKALLELAKNFQKEGFRKGKVPTDMVEKELGEEKVMAEAAELCIKDNYIKAIKENKIEALGQPKVEILKLAPGNPVEFKATVSVMPEIQLPDYRKIASGIQKKEITVTESEIAKLKEQKERNERERLRQEVLEKIGKESKVEIPPILLESEQGRMLENLKQQVGQMLGMSFDAYLQKIGKNESEVFDSLKPEAEKKVLNSLVLKEIAKQENLDATEDEIKAESDKITKQYPQVGQLDQERIREYSKDVIKNEKAFKLLEEAIK